MIKDQTHGELEFSVKGLDTVRNEILNGLLLALYIFTVFPLVASLLRIPDIGWQHVISLSFSVMPAQRPNIAADSRVSLAL